MAMEEKLDSGRVGAQLLAANVRRYGDLDEDMILFPEPLSLKQYYVDSDAVLDEVGGPN